MSREERIQIIKALEQHYKSEESEENIKIIVLFHSSRRGPLASAKMHIEQIRYIFEHVKEDQYDKIILFLYTHGGDVNVPLRLVQLIREHCNTFEVMIPFCAHSAGTLICLGADKIIMGKMAELSPIDPTTSNPFNPEDKNNKPNKIPISVEDVTAYLNLAIDKYGISGEDKKLEVFSRLTKKIHPLALGNVYRKIQLIRILANKLIELQNEENRPEPEIINRIVENLTEKFYTHDFFIGREEAKNLELSVKESNEELEKLMWNLYELYEKESQMLIPFSPEKIFDDNIGNRQKFKLPDNFKINIPKTLKGNPQIANEIVRNIVQQIVPNVQDVTPINEIFPSAFIESTERSDIYYINAKITGSIQPSGKRDINVFFHFEWKTEK